MSLVMATPLSPLIVQRRLVELGRLRLGEKGERGEPKQRSTWRITSASARLLESVAEVYGGKVRPWAGAPDEGYFEVATDARELDILIPPTVSSYSQSLELWDAGGCARRCDGVTEKISGRPCMCDPDARECKVTTRVSVMLPKVPGLGVWRLDSHGWNAAAELPTTLETMGALAPGQWVPAVLRIEKQSSKKRVNGKAQTRRFVVPKIDIVSGTIGDALDGALSAVPAPRLDAGPSRREKVSRPALGPAAPLPERAQLHAGERRERTTSAGEAAASAHATPSPAPTPEPDFIDGTAVELARCEAFHAELGRCVRQPGHPEPDKSKAFHADADGRTWKD